MKLLPESLKWQACDRLQMLLLIGCVSFLKTPLMADEYAVHGTVISIRYDVDGSHRGDEVEPSFSESNGCEFVWYRKGETWRLDIKEPLSPFPEGLWKSIMPFTERALVFVTPCPSLPDNPKAGGNAVVKVVTNRFLTAENYFGAHAVWLSHNIEEVLAMIGPSNRCPPFLDYDPAIHDLQVNTHEIRQTNGLVMFWNLGRYFARDSDQRIVYEHGQPQLLPYPLLADTGFMEAQQRASASFLDQVRRIPGYTELTYWVPFRDETKPSGVRMAMHSKLIVKNESLDTNPIAESVFLPSWTNAYATVFDYREMVSSNQPLFYITKAQSLSPSPDELSRRKKMDAQIRSAAQSSRHSSGRPTNFLPRLLILLALGILPVGFWLVFRKRRQPSE